jgi:hypothetical protein
VFATLERVAAPQLVAALAVLVGFLIAIRLRSGSPALSSDVAWPMAGSLLCAGRVSVVPAMDAGVSSVTLHAAHHHLDGEHYPHLRRLTFTYTGLRPFELPYQSGRAREPLAIDQGEPTR